MEAQPIGTIHVKRRTSRKQVRHQRFIKVSHHGGYRNRWRPFARYWWEQNVGRIPDGFQVFHRDGDSLNDAPENLILTREQRFVQIFSIQSSARKTRERRQAQAVAKSNRLRGQINASQLQTKAWYVVLPESRIIIWRPRKTAAQARRIAANELVTLCHEVRAKIKARGGIPFAAGHPVEFHLGSEIIFQSQPDGRMEGFWRLVPDTRPTIKSRAASDLENESGTR